ncbi:nucleotidyltransferase family protein [Aerophototrophica crusticola]|uniref:Nucleotidyltransferase family protein n=2 Tax=Aerophototrophica crusticola TaxID=1709002 RepID=A0A858RBH9_9PROT|nr:nucleotidyltransferase family protein [Rhodospirillaceae bacterium B3]
MPPNIETIRTALDRRATELARYKVRGMSVFGSVARREAGSDSDIDLLVEFDERRRPTLIDLVGLEHFLADLFQGPVDVVEATGLKPGIRDRVLRDAVKVF